MPDGTKPLPEPMLIFHSVGYVAFTRDQCHRFYLVDILFCMKSLKVILLKLLLHVPVFKELCYSSYAQNLGPNMIIVDFRFDDERDIIKTVCSIYERTEDTSPV